MSIAIHTFLSGLKSYLYALLYKEGHKIMYFLDKYNNKYGTHFGKVTDVYGEQGEIQFTIQKGAFMTEVGSFSSSYTFQSPICISEENEKGSKTIDITGKIFLTEKSLLQYTKNNNSEDLQFTLLIDENNLDLDIEYFCKIMKFKKQECFHYKKRLLYNINISNIFAKSINRNSSLKKAVGVLVGKHTKVSGNISVLTSELGEKLQEERDWLSISNGIFPGYKLYEKHPNGVDGGDLRKQIITRTVYGKKVTEREKILLKKGIQCLIDAGFFDIKGNIFYPGGGGSDKINFLKKHIKKIVFLDKSPELLSSGETDEYFQNIYGDFYDLSELEKVENLIMTFILGGDLGNMFSPQEAFSYDGKTFDIKRGTLAGIKNYIHQVSKYSHVGVYHMYGFFTDSQAKKSFYEIYNDDLFGEILVQPLLELIDDTGLNISKNDENYRKNLENDLKGKVTYERVWKEKEKEGRLCMLGFRVNKGCEVKIKRKRSNQTKIFHAGEFICMNVTYRINKNRFIEQCKKQGQEIEFYEYDGETGFISICMKQTRNSNYRKNENFGHENITGQKTINRQSKMRNYMITVEIIRTLLLGLLSLGTQEVLQSNIQENIRYIEHMNEGLPQDNAIPIQYAYDYIFMEHIREFCDEIKIRYGERVSEQDVMKFVTRNYDKFTQKQYPGLSVLMQFFKQEYGNRKI